MPKIAFLLLFYFFITTLSVSFTYSIKTSGTLYTAQTGYFFFRHASHFRIVDHLQCFLRSDIIYEDTQIDADITRYFF